MHNGILKSDGNISQRTVYGLEYKILIFPEFRKFSQISIHSLRPSFLFSFYFTLGSFNQSLILATTLLLHSGLEWVLASLWPKSPSPFHFQFLSFQTCVMCSVHSLLVLYGKGTYLLNITSQEFVVYDKEFETWLLLKSRTSY